MNRSYLCWLAGINVLLLSCATKGIQKVENIPLTQYVYPFIGTGFHGHVFLGANVPFGAVQLGPTNITQGWDWCSGYHYSDSTIMGFSHTHLSGTGIGDLGDILFMPVTGNVTLARGVAGKPESGYYSLFSHDEEKAVPGYYSVNLKRYNIKAELTATERVGFHQYTFPASDSSRMIIDLEMGIGWDRPMDTYIKQEGDSTIVGYRFSKGWAVDQRIFFVAKFSKPIKEFLVYDSTSLKKSITEGTGRRIKGLALFQTIKDEKIQVKVGISPVSIQNALGNIEAEIPAWDFDGIVKKADAAWNNELNKIKITSDDTTRLRTFYTALYHTMIAPSIFNDHNGDYRGTDKKIYEKAGFTNLTTFSLWDTYRAAHPLYTIFQQERVKDMVNSMLAIYQQQGKLPVWHLMGNETNTMPGNSAIQVIADAYLKGFNGFDTALAWEAVKATAMQDERGLKYIKELGFIPADSMVESVAMGLEYAIADWAIREMAERMGREKDASYFSGRAMNYGIYFDPSVGFMRGRLDSNWRTPFSPFVSRHMKDDFAEGNAWQYTWLVPQDVGRLIDLLGGKDKFIAKLDSLFMLKTDMGEEASSDITGLIGQYAHGNEPSHHIPYLYMYVGQPWKTADKVRYILDSLYSDKPDGLCGNEDVGQMSAWYVLSALGFYQVGPSSGKYVFGSPIIDGATLTMAEGRQLTITVKNNSRQNKYIQSVTLNGQKYDESFISYKDIVAGGNLIIEMGPQPSKDWGTNPCPKHPKLCNLL